MIDLLNKLTGWAGGKTKAAALLVAILALNMAVPFLPAGTESVIFYVANALGLVGVRDAIDKLKPA